MTNPEQLDLWGFRAQADWEWADTPLSLDSEGSPRQFKAELVNEGPVSAWLSFLDEGVECSASVKDGCAKLHLRATLASRLESTISLDSVLALLRDREGRLLEMADWVNSAKFTRAQEIVAELEVHPNTITSVASIEVLVRYEYRYRKLLAVAEVPPLKIQAGRYRESLPLTVQTKPVKPGHPHFSVLLDAVVGRHSDLFFSLVMQMRREHGTLERSFDVPVVLRDEGGMMIAREFLTSRQADSLIVAQRRLSFNLTRDQIEKIRSVHIGMIGDGLRIERLGRFRIK